MSERVPEPPDGDERAILLGWLEFHRDALRANCAGLDAQQLAARSAPPSSLSLIGLVRHLTEMERAYAAWALGPAGPWRGVWGEYTDDGPEWDFDVDASVVDASMAAWRRPRTGRRPHRRARHARLRRRRQRPQPALEPAEAGRRVRPPQRPRRPRPRAHRRLDRRVGGLARGAASTAVRTSPGAPAPRTGRAGRVGAAGRRPRRWPPRWPWPAAPSRPPSECRTGRAGTA